jgi:UDP-glucuronate 4-epimerase
MRKILVTGVAGFVGFHLAKRLFQQGDQVIGIDNLNSYYDVSLKKDRLAQLPTDHFTFHRLDLADKDAILTLFSQESPNIVVHLAAQAGVRYSLQNPYAYIDSNIVGFTNILEGCRHNDVEHLVFASSSSVYGANTKIPFAVEDRVDTPVSLYAATKKANELMAHTYSHLYQIPTTGLRFFTVYGEWGRPDMAYFSFTKAILEGKPIKVFNHGKMKRDFTYIDDIIEGVVRVIDHIPEPEAATDDRFSKPAYKLYNIGNNKPIELMHFISTLEDCLGIEAVKEMYPMQPGDVYVTYADVDDLMQDVGFRPDTPIDKGLARFVKWYRDYYEV